jgi:hypothetical protein
MLCPAAISHRAQRTTSQTDKFHDGSTALMRWPATRKYLEQPVNVTPGAAVATDHYLVRRQTQRDSDRNAFIG